MIIKTTHFSDVEHNEFFRKNVYPNGDSMFSIVKIVVYGNQFTKQTEYHLWYSPDKNMLAGMHLRNGGK